MNKTGWFFASFSAWIIGFALLGSPQQPLPPPQQPSPTPPIVLPPLIDADLIGVQVPIPKSCRVFNESGYQCVWCSIECLGRYHGIKDLYEDDKRITKHYTRATGPGEVARVLSTRYPTLKWRQIQNKAQMRAFIKRYVVEKKFGVGLATPGHMVNLVHYDEQARIVKVIDNANPRALQVQTWTMDKFDRVADGWVLTIFPPGYYETWGDNSFDCTLTDPDKLYGIFLKQRCTTN